MTENDKTLEHLRTIRYELASEILPPSFAKLYSHYTRISMNQPGLRSWRESEFSERLADAVALIDAGLSEREIGREGWREALKRSGELLEWLTHPELNIDRLPLRLLSAGVYQLAGYPALSLGLLNSEQNSSNESKILTALLRADFPKLFTLIIDYWNTELTNCKKRGGTFRQIDISDVNRRFVDETVRALGVLCAYMRWGDSARLKRALRKLSSLSDIMIYGTDTYSWLLSKIVAEVVREYVSSSMRSYVQKLKDDVSDRGKKAFEKYLRSNYLDRKSIVWYSQVRGIERLLQDGSFALCTPTGSGKTTIAELAIIQSIFRKYDKDIFITDEPIVMYLVPSRALAAEVESKLKSVLESHSIKVTGLYGGIDWGPTDAWITSVDPTVLICTYEKGEALIRFLGPLFLNRVVLVVIDEAHSIQFNGKDYVDLRKADNRSLRLELLANRLLCSVGEKRIIALSAVADKNDYLAHWVSGNERAEPVHSTYRSTRQLIGRLMWSPSGQYEICYDILNGHSLQFNNDGHAKDVPYIQKPFDPFPVPFNLIKKRFTSRKNGVDKRQRPYLFWAAMQLAQPDEEGIQHSVLISITQNVGGYADDFLYVLNETLAETKLPNFFIPPSDSNHEKLFEKCLSACADYFGFESTEFQLLQKGIVVHHGSMPGVLARLMVELIQKRIVHIVLATSTLSEGVNLPFETIIIPTLLRRREPLPASEFKNLVGRAGRPGSGTEGRSLVFLESRPSDSSSYRAHQSYKSIIDELTQVQLPEDVTMVSSPLGALMSYIRQEWERISGSSSDREFMEWLEKTIPLKDSEKDVELIAQEALDSLDGYLLSILVEKEMITGQNLNDSDLEQYLIDVWRKTYAHYVIDEPHFWEKMFATRGKAIHKRVYPNSETRRRLYRTSVSPRYGKKILDGYNEIREHLKTGTNYSEWPVEQRLKYIIETVQLISNLDKFRIDNYASWKNAPTWEQILVWWLNPSEATRKPKTNQVSKWIGFVKKQFEYKFNWGLGSVLSVILDDVNDGELQEMSIIDEWLKTGLPWIVFWLKELITWGTLDPVAASLLAHRVEYTRTAAETRANAYYKIYATIPVDEKLNPTKIKEWLRTFDNNEEPILPKSRYKKIKARLTRDFSKTDIKDWRVLPIIHQNSIIWIDPAGYELATSQIPVNWSSITEGVHDFILNTESKTVKVSSYL